MGQSFENCEDHGSIVNSRLHRPATSAPIRIACPLGTSSVHRHTEVLVLTSTFLTIVFHIFPLLNLEYTGNSPFSVLGILYRSEEAPTEDGEADEDEAIG